MTTPQENAADSGALSIDQFAATLDAEAAEPAAAVAEEEEEQAEPELEAEEEVEAFADDEEEVVEEEEAEPIPDPPASWSKEDREAWDELTPKARDAVLRRAAEDRKAISEASNKAAGALRAVQELSQQTQQIAHLAVDAFELKWKEKTEGQIPWAQWARQMDPQEYQALRAEYDADVKQRDDAKSAAQQQSHIARSAFYAEEGKKLVELAPDLADQKEGPARRQKVATFLTERGIPQEALEMISATELSIAYDAYRYREMQARAKERAALPRKNPTSTAKAVPVGGAAAGAHSSTSRDLAVANTRLTKTGSIDALVGVFNAEDAAKARKVRQK